MAKRHAKVQYLDNLTSMYLHTNLWVSVTVAETQYIAENLRTYRIHENIFGHCCQELNSGCGAKYPGNFKLA